MIDSKDGPASVDNLLARLSPSVFGLARRVAREFYAQRHLLALAGSHVVAATLFLLLMDRAAYLSFTLYLSNEFHYVILGLILLRISFGILYRRVRYDAQAVYPFLMTWGERICRGLPMLLVMPFVVSTFSSVKSTLLHLRPTTIDSKLAAIDQFVHGGVDPWMLIQQVVGNPAVTRVIDALYVFWIPMIVIVTYWQLFQGYNLRARFQYLASSILVWFLLGNVLAALFPSGGPVYFGELTGKAERYAALFSYLQDVDVVALDIQARLWEGYASGTPGEYFGISAMPSVHVGLAMCMAFAGWKYNRWIGGALSLYAVSILVGSVHLGWHYAIDGYASFLIVPFLWWGAGRVYDDIAIPSPERPKQQPGWAT